MDEYLFGLLSIPVQERTPNNLKDIIEFFEEKLILKLFKHEKAQELDPDSINECFSKNMEIQFLKPEENLFHIDDYGDKFYLILRGDVKVFIPSRKFERITNLKYFEYLKSLLFEEENNLTKIILNENLILSLNRNNKNEIIKQENIVIDALSKDSNFNENKNDNNSNNLNLIKEEANNREYSNKNSDKGDNHEISIMSYNSFSQEKKEKINFFQKGNRKSSKIINRSSLSIDHNSGDEHEDKSILYHKKYIGKRERKNSSKNRKDISNIFKLEEFQSFNDFESFCKIKYKREIYKKLKNINSQVELINFYDSENPRIKKFLGMNLKFKDFDFFVKEKPEDNNLVLDIDLSRNAYYNLDTNMKVKINETKGNFEIFHILAF